MKGLAVLIAALIIAGVILGVSSCHCSSSLDGLEQETIYRQLRRVQSETTRFKQSPQWNTISDHERTEYEERLLTVGHEIRELEKKYPRFKTTVSP